ncbi:MAG: toll/interleukin-1 receptor domain-containing protein [Saprospiraceae bacterium]
MPEPTSPLNIFIIYARADADALAEFKKSLTPLVRRGEVAIWYDAEIIPGQEWEKAIEKNLKAADIIVLFLSSDFFNSHYIEKKELREALLRHEKEEVVVTPVVVRHCLWQEHPQIESLQVLPDNALPVFSKKHWDGPDEAFTNVAAGIARVARAIVKKRQEGSVEALLEKAAAEYDQENFEAAFLVFDQYKDSPLFLVEYQRRLGRMYDLGQFVSIDYHQAKMWYDKAVENEDGWAMNNIGTLYYRGQGVGQDYQIAKSWYEKAAEKGNAVAMNNLGLLYQNGNGVTQDYQIAKIWYEKAAEKGNADAMRNLGLLYQNGNGVIQNYQIAKIWYEKAAKEGNAMAINDLGVLYYNGQGVTQDYQIAKNWYEKAAEKGNGVAMHNLGGLYYNGQGVIQDYQMAKNWYEKAAEKGDADAMENLGLLYEQGLGVPKDPQMVKHWYYKAEQQKKQ